MNLKDYVISFEQRETIRIHGRPIPFCFSYDCAELEDGGEITACSFVSEQVPGKPVLFITNGGPGSAAAWQNLGFFGPWRIHLNDVLNPDMVPPFSLEENPHCLLDTADVVLIDPPGTGCSRTGSRLKEYESIDGDAEIIARFIEAWRRNHSALQSRIFLAGESYGTLRMPAVMDALMGGPFAITRELGGLAPAGIILLGSVISTGAALSQPPVEECALRLMSDAAIHAYHSGKEPKEAAEKAWAFVPRYLTSLFRGNSLEEPELRENAEILSGFTGIPSQLLAEQQLVFTPEDFSRFCVRGSVIGTYDGRFLMKGPAVSGSFPFPGNTDPVAEDPAMGRYSPAFSAGMNLLREHYGLPKNQPYHMIRFDLNAAWDYASRHTPLGSLENGARRNPSLKIFFGTGLFDLCTPAGNVRYTAAHCRINPEQIILKEYESGHMPYLGEASAAQLEKDLREFLQAERKAG